VDIEIRPMRDEELDALQAAMRADYVAAMVDDGGFPFEVAEAKASVDTDALLPDGRPTPDQAFFVIEADGGPVGRLWLAERPQPLHHGALWILELHVDEPHRGKGYGRAALEFAEQEAARRGLERLALNVWGGNETARKLYRSLGYREQAVLMGKQL
jgi:GNAT superfamily N-acetyltransferase